jgi:hypothetical protein
VPNRCGVFQFVGAHGAVGGRAAVTWRWLGLLSSPLDVVTSHGLPPINPGYRRFGFPHIHLNAKVRPYGLIPRPISNNGG